MEQSHHRWKRKKDEPSTKDIATDKEQNEQCDDELVSFSSKKKSRSNDNDVNDHDYKGDNKDIDTTMTNTTTTIKIEQQLVPPTFQQYVLTNPEEYNSLPKELRNIDYNKDGAAAGIYWRKIQKQPCSSKTPALTFVVHAVSKLARACTLHLPKGRTVPTPIFMPVGTKGTIKAVSTFDLQHDPNNATNPPIILSNTYHLALQPGTDVVKHMGGLHKFMNWNGGLLTDSGGFQMVSLLKLAEITEEGVTFDDPYHQNNNEINGQPSPKRMLLRPEDSIRHQNEIGSDIIMALDDVVSSTTCNDQRFEIATYRTLRWYDRCLAAHSFPETQNLFPIIQGGLDISKGGLRDRCLAGFKARDISQKGNIPGYAIGGLAGGESKEDFWKVVHHCCQALPDDKPRYVMGVGYPLDLVVCTSLGVDMYDCVYPTRTARFGVALVAGNGRGNGGLMKLRNSVYFEDGRPIDENCKCQACWGGLGGREGRGKAARLYTSRSALHRLSKAGNPLAATLLTHHNIAYMMSLVRGMRGAIIEGKFDEFVRNFLIKHFSVVRDCVKDGNKDASNGNDNNDKAIVDIPVWVKEALMAAGINVDF